MKISRCRGCKHDFDRFCEKSECTPETRCVEEQRFDLMPFIARIDWFWCEFCVRHLDGIKCESCKDEEEEKDDECYFQEGLRKCGRCSVRGVAQCDLPLDIPGLPDER